MSHRCENFEGGMKLRVVGLVVGLWLGWMVGPLAAQTGPGRAGQAAADATQAANAAQAAGGGGLDLSRFTGNIESNTLLTIIERAFDTNSDSFDLENGTFNWKGHRYNMGQFRAFRGRFERYLALPNTSDNEVYRAIVNEVFALLSTRSGMDARDNMLKAWELLYRAAEYEADGGASLSVANQVFNAWRIRDEREALRMTQSELWRLRRRQQQNVGYHGDLIAREGTTSVADAASSATVTLPGTVAPTPGAGGTGGGGTGGGAQGGVSVRPGQVGGSPSVGPISHLFRTRELAETEAKIQEIEASRVLTGAEAKLQFQSQLVSLFLQRRFQHCLIAASFYRYIFTGQAQTLETGREELASFLPTSNMAITVETLELLSREAINEVESSMNAVRANFEDGQHIAALERLQETFFLGEHLSALNTMEREKKQVLLRLYRKVDEARKLADLRDFEAVERLVKEIGETTTDFRSAEVISAIRAAQRMSTLALTGAQQAAAAGDFIRAQDGIQRAAELWPLNPAIQTYTENMAQQVDIGSQAALLFDDAMGREDFRRLYDQRSELAVALMNDTVRGPALRDVIEKMSRVEIFMIQSRELLAQNNAFAAWESLEMALPLAPNDVQINQRRAELAPRVADFVGRLDTAKRHERAGRHAVALTQFLAAQELYPASAVARLGVERVSELLLNGLEFSAAAPVGTAEDGREAGRG